MPLLALNTVLPQNMRVKYQLVIGLLPISLMFASFLPLWLFGGWLESHFGIPVNSPIREHPDGSAWIAVFLSTVVALMVLGYAMGWVVNAFISRYILGWPAEKVRAVYLHSKVPTHWLKEGSPTSGTADARSMEKWEAQRKAGALRFIAVRGVLAWGGPMLVAMHLVPTFIKGQALSLDGSLFHIALWICAGASFGAFIWYSSEANYRKLKRRSEVGP